MTDLLNPNLVRCRFRHTLFAAAAAFALAAAPALTAAGPEAAPYAWAKAPLELATMGSFAFGGTVETRSDGQTFHGDHGYAQYYIPVRSRTLPVVMWHGIGQSGKTFESTPDGREGYQALLPRNRWPVYLIDQPRRGRAGYTSAPLVKTDIPTTTSEAGVWRAFRNGPWLPPGKAAFHPGSQFPQTGYAVDQFFRQQTPDTGEEPATPEYRTQMGRTIAKLFERIGPGILLTHSASGQYGWEAAMESGGLIRAVVAYEPGMCAFPEDEQPPAMDTPVPLVAVRAAPRLVARDRWMRLTKIPIVIFYGDNIADKPGPVFNDEIWRHSLARARQFVDMVNRYGGDARLVELPKLGLRGNTHVPFADKNNLAVAQVLFDWLHEKGLDGDGAPHTGPKPVEMPMTVPLAQ